MLTLFGDFMFAAVWLAGIVIAVGLVVFFAYMLVDLIGEKIYGKSPLERRLP